MPWNETDSLYSLLWVEGTPDPDEEDRVTEWLFRTEAEAEAFLAEEIAEAVRLNEDNLPPATVRAIREDLAKGVLWAGAVDRYVEAMEEFFGSSEWIHMAQVPVMAR